MIEGYKCFNKDLTNRYGSKFEVGKLYHAKNTIKFGVDGNGFHMCHNLEDTLRFFDTWKNEVTICKVIGFGEYVKRSDDYNEYYDMYACEYMYINEILTREEILNYALELGEVKILRFISLYKLTTEEKDIIAKVYQNYQQVLDYLEYYQNNKKDTFTKKLIPNN